MRRDGTRVVIERTVLFCSVQLISDQISEQISSHGVDSVRAAFAGEWVGAGAHADAEPVLHVARERRRVRARDQVGGQVVQVEEHLVAVAAQHSTNSHSYTRVTSHPAVKRLSGKRELQRVQV